MAKSSDEIKNDLRRAGAYQQMTLPDGTVLGGNDRGYLNDTIFYGDVSGQTMLDIGSYLGFFCLEGMRRGMKKATGLEPFGDSIKLARQLAEHLKLGSEYIQGDFESWESNDKFDIILCLNVLHHMYDPVHAIRRMMQMARRRVVLEVAVPTWGEVSRSGINPIFPLVSKNVPVIVCGHRGGSAHAAARTFMFSKQSLELIFNYHSNLYEPIETFKSPMKQRMVVKAERRQIKTLTVVSGPSGSGKTTFVKRLLEDSSLLKKLNLPEKISSWTGPGHKRNLPNGPQEHAVLHYDMLRPHGHSIRCYAHDPLLDLLKVAEKINFVTIFTPRQRLCEQLAKNEGKSKGIFAKKVKMDKRHEKLIEFYKTGDFLDARYGEWFDHCSLYKDKTQSHTLVENLGEYKFHSFGSLNELKQRSLC